MEDLWENLITSWEMGDDNLFGHSHMNSFDEEMFLREIVQKQPDFSLESAYHSSTMQYNSTATSTMDSSLTHEEASIDERHGNMIKSNSSNSIISQDAATRKRATSSPTSFILSFENSAVEPALHTPCPTNFGDGATPSSTLCDSLSVEPMAKQGTKKVRSSSEIRHHIVAERKRRQELTERFIALSAAIPGLKKTDKAYILRAAINYMKQLQERVKELENENKRTKDSVISIKKSQVCTKEDNRSCETNCDSWHNSKKPLPQVEARVFEKEILIGIYCDKQRDIVLKIMALLQNLHLSLACSSVLPFGASTLKVTVIAKMGDKYCLSVNDLVRNLRQDLLMSHDIQK